MVMMAAVIYPADLLDLVVVVVLMVGLVDWPRSSEGKDRHYSQVLLLPWVLHGECGRGGHFLCVCIYRNEYRHFYNT